MVDLELELELELGRLRFRAIGTLVSVALAGVAVALVIAYPQFGQFGTDESSFHLHIPAEAWVAAIAAPTAIGFGIATAQSGALSAVLARQDGWKLTFLALLPLQFLVPGYLICAFSSVLPFPRGWQFDEWVRLAYASAGVLTLCGLLALAYGWATGARRRARLRA